MYIHVLLLQKIRLLQDKVDSLSTENTHLKVKSNKCVHLLCLMHTDAHMLSLSHTHTQSEANKLRQRLTSSGSVAASGQLPARKLGAPQAQSSSPLSFIAVVLILVAIILGYLVGKSF